MTDLEQQLTEHLHRRASAAVPRYDLDGVEQAGRVVALVDEDGRRPRRPIVRTIAGVAAAVVLVVALAAVVTRSGTEPSTQETTGTKEPRSGDEVIVFDRVRGAGWDLAAQDPETGDTRTLVATEGIVDCPETMDCNSFISAAEWSADRRWVAFTVTATDLDGRAIGPCVGTVGVWVTSDGDPPRQLTAPCDPQAGPAQPDVGPDEQWAWSPAGARLAYARVDGAQSELLLIDPTDGSQRSLGTVPGEVGHLGWSPDGTRIAYSVGGAVYQVEVDGAERSLLSDAFNGIVEVAWSPDGSQILVHDQGRYRIQVMDADGSDLHVVLEGEDACCNTAWSPQGDRIVYFVSISRESDPLFNFYVQVWTISPDGSNPVKVFDASTCEGRGKETDDALPVWSPDGTQIGYYGCGEWVVADANGTGEPQPMGGHVDGAPVPLLHKSWGGGGLTGEDLRQIGQWEH
jgi:WD40-like Beta Propeller Repeat